MGGEKADIDDDGLHYKGSPPRGRGKVSNPAWNFANQRITPAWAGKRCCCPTAASRSGDHPHTGGEKGTLPLLVCWWAGSPPRRRGKVALVVVPVDAVGITPRTGGEKLGKISAPNIGQGSPPHRRGKVFQKPLVFAVFGITPAQAGKS